MGSNEDKLGFNKKKMIDFSWIFKNNYDEGLLNKNVFKMDCDNVDLTLEKIIKAIAGTDAGCSISTISFDTLSQSASLKSFLKLLILNWKRLKIKYLLDKHCQPLKGNLVNKDTDPHSRLKSDKCSYTTDHLFYALGPAIRSALDEVDMKLLETEFGSADHLNNADSLFWLALSWKQVYSFLLSVIHHTIPTELFGSKSNFNCFIRSIKTILMMGKYDSFNLDQLMFEVKVLQCSWIEEFSTLQMKSECVAKVWLWLLNNFILVILKACFYVTESSHKKNQVFFFRKKNWQILHDKAFANLMKKGHWHLLTVKEFNAFTKVTFSCGSPLVTSKLALLRFLPKEKDLRPIIPVRAAGISKTELLKAKLLIGHMTNVLFKSVPSVRLSIEFQEAWLKYHDNIEKHQGSSSQTIFAVKMDVKDAFGSIQHKILLELLNKASLKFGETVLFGTFVTTNRYGKHSKAKLIPLDEYGRPVGRNATQNLITAGYPMVVNVRTTLNNIDKLISGQIFRLGKSKRFIIRCGIAQGASLSSALCEFYYSAMCEKYLSPFNFGTNLLMRSVDDFLFLTFSKELATQYQNFMETGIEEFNCYINRAKTISNLQGQAVRIPFKGFHFCTVSRQLLISVGLLWKCPPRYTVRLNVSRSPGKFVLLKLQQIAHAQYACHFLHPKSVTLDAMISNVWRGAMLCGGRLVSLIKVLLLPRKNLNSRFIFKGLKSTGGFVWGRIRGLWEKFGREIGVSRQFILSVFLGGIHITLGRPGHPPLALLRRIIKKWVRNRVQSLTFRNKDLLPDYVNNLAL